MKKLIQKHRIFFSFVVISSLFWLWGWTVQAGRITDNTVVAYATITVCWLIVEGISATIFTHFFRYLKQKYAKDRPVIWLLRAVVVWAVAEALVGWLIALAWMGQNGKLDSTLPFSSLTPFLMYTPLRFLSRFTGFYGLSAVVGVGIVSLFLKKTRKLAMSYWAIVLLLNVASWQLYRHPSLRPINATLVAEKLDQKITVDPQDSQLVLLPEYGLDAQSEQSSPARFKESSKPFYYVGSRQTQVKNGHTNVLIFGNNIQGNTTYQAKNRLIPNGEYLPYGFEVATWFVSRNTYNDFTVRRAVIKGSQPIQPFKINHQLIVGAEVCSSIMSTRDYRQLTKKGSTVLTNSASLEIFEGSRLYAVQDRGFATFMAVANARPFLQSTNHWPAMAIDQNGVLLKQISPINQTQVQISPNSAKTPYTYLGEWVAVIGGLLITYEGVLRIRNSRKR